MPEGDHRLVVEFGAESATWITRELGLSIATRATERVAAARIKLDAKIDAPALERATATRLLELLEPLLAGETLETDVPAARLLRELEGLGELAADRRSYVAFHPGEFLLRVPIGNRAVDVRLSSPPVAEGELRPCVVALHGAGGSDNLFFDGHGNGAAVRLASERGWLFVAPKAPFFGSVDVAGLLDALGERYAVDRSRVYLVGHSMGAAQALSFAREHPEAVAALAVIGGGRPGKCDAALARLPVYVAAGSEDFGRAGARALHASLVEHGGKPRLDVRRGIEHLTIVQEVLPTVYGFFDGVAARGESR